MSQRVALRGFVDNGLIQFVHHMFGWFLLYLAITARELSLIKIMSIANNIPNESYSHQLRESLSKQSGMSIAASPSKKETFISKVERFQSSSTIVTPGPGAY